MKKRKSLFGTEALSFPFCILAIFIVIIWFTGGSSRADVDSLLILRPVSVIALGIGLWTLKKQHLLSQKLLIILLLSFLLIHTFYLLPLLEYPPYVYDNSKFWVEIFKSDLRYSITLNPTGALNSFFSVILPSAILLLAIQIKRNEQMVVLKIILVLGFLSSTIGLLQILDNSSESLYLYRITNFGSSVGLFANRNHQALFLSMLFPMLTVYGLFKSRSSGQTAAFRIWIVLLCEATLVPLILITGSRAGLILGLIAIAMALFLYSSERLSAKKNWKWQIFGSVVGVAVVGMATVFMSRAEAWDRLFEAVEFDGSRSVLWAAASNIVGDYLPWGTGPGGFPAAFASAERRALLDPTYVNHAHNDWLEWFATFGLPGMGLMMVSLALFLLGVVQKFRDPGENSNSQRLLKVGCIIILLVALGSIGDYPLRTPIISCLCALALCWTMVTYPEGTYAGLRLDSEGRHGQRTPQL
jgi:O-antigen ligase